MYRHAKIARRVMEIDNDKITLLSFVVMVCARNVLLSCVSPTQEVQMSARYLSRNFGGYGACPFRMNSCMAARYFGSGSLAQPKEAG
jgi:hypothetical protein